MGPIGLSRTVATVAVALLGLGGCQSDYRSSSALVASQELAGAYPEAADTAAKALAAGGDDSVSRVIYLLEAGRTAQIAGRTEDSTRYYDTAFQAVLPYLDTEPEARVTEAITTTLVNQTISEYRGTVTDRIMLNTLQAINRLRLGQPAEARIELNRARAWQQDAVEKAQEEIERSERALSKKAEDEGLPAESLEVPPALREAYAGLGDLEAYADWRNPFTSWLRGIFLIANATDAGDLGNARFDLREVVAMNPDASPLVDPDLESLELNRFIPSTWVVFMSGLAPRLEEFRLDIPIPVGDVNYVAAAFPVLEPVPDAPSGLRLEVGDRVVEGVLLADVDAMIAADYSRRLPVIVMQEVLSAAIKTVGTWAASQAAGDSGGLVNLAGIIYQAVTTAADLRTWRTLPKFIYAARTSTPPSGTISVRTSDDRLLGTVRVQPSEHNLVVATLPGPAAPQAGIESIRLAPGAPSPTPAPEVDPGSTVPSPSERNPAE